MTDENIRKVKRRGKNVPKRYTKEQKEVLEVEQEGWWVYVLLLSTIVILAHSLKDYTFSFDNITLTYSLFVLPVVYFVTNYITKKYGYAKSVVGIAISGLLLVLFALVMSFVIGRNFSFYDISGEFCGYVVSQFVNLTIYQFLLVNTTGSFILTFLTYMFAFVVYYLFYTLLYMNLLVFDNYWVSYFSTLILQGMLCLLLTFFDVHIKKGLEI